MDHCPPKMVKASGDSLGFLLILKMEIVNIFLIEGKLLANFLKYAIVCTLKKNPEENQQEQCASAHSSPVCVEDTILCIYDVLL